MTIIFKAKTREGYSLKVLAELLQSNIKTACFEIDSKGIRLRMMDNHKTILIDIDLNSDNFSTFKYKGEEKLYIGINLNHFHKMLKSIKKRDSIKLFINDASPNDLGIKVIPKENNRVTTSFIKIQNVQNLDIEIPDGYEKPVNVHSGEFQKMCKGLINISNITKITSKEFLIRFVSDAGGVMKRSTEFGETDDSDDDDDSANEDVNEYEDDFDTEQLTKITKLAGLGSNLYIYSKKGKPLLFKSQIGSLGKISIYLKSKSIQEDESKSIREDEEENGTEDD
jgi:proliferating cell nuclear antigen PCNA